MGGVHALVRAHVVIAIDGGLFDAADATIGPPDLDGADLNPGFLWKSGRLKRALRIVVDIPIVMGAAIEEIVSCPPIDDVVIVAALNVVDTFASQQRIVA